MAELGPTATSSPARWRSPPGSASTPSLLSGTREKLGALLSWGNDYVSKKRPDALVDHPDDYRIDWDAED